MLSENLDLKFHYNLCPHILISQLAKIELLARSTVSSFCALNPSPGAQLMWSNEMIADILPNGQLCTSKLILKVLTTALGQTPLIECNRSAKLGYNQFYQINVCVDKMASPSSHAQLPSPISAEQLSTFHLSETLLQDHQLDWLAQQLQHITLVCFGLSKLNT